MAASASASAKVSFIDFICISVFPFSSIPKQVGVFVFAPFRERSPKQRRGFA
jgi:hypothetical protein